ncbi:NAD(P)H-quinone oxidoreductase [uncultured Cohaesibacter sp.]|uniref:NAD(P)H-quinone oxidoreductase n=1 Tax=uncultured Cohaesibacter sp. TaxID=1002546 RepID=UPI00292F2772|nr:NAD(P)H-quinone oxidoreductase [uncultured Cohaesibacter sp.]
MMKVVEFRGAGGPEILHLARRDRPRAKAGEVLVRVLAAGVNRPDIQQRRGLYPPPPGASDLPGLDVAGIIETIGEGVQNFHIGDPVCALVNGGGYAEYCAVSEKQCLAIPRGLTFEQAASLPEVFFTAWNNIFLIGRLSHGESLLVQGGTSGVGLAAIQMARHLRNATVFATAGNQLKLQTCVDVGCAGAFDYHGNWAEQVRSAIGEQGIDLILDGQAGAYTQKHLDLLASGGRVVLIASHLGAVGEINFRQMVRRHQTLCGSTLRPCSAEFKGRIARDLMNEVWPLLEDGRIETKMHAVIPFDEVAEAHRILDANVQIGKVVLSVMPDLSSSIPNEVQGD